MSEPLLSSLLLVPLTREPYHEGDDDVLELLAKNVTANTAPPATACGARVSRLVWGSDDPLAALGLSKHPDLVLASDVVYGNDPAKWRQLIRTMCDLSGPKTLVIIGNVQRYPVHHPMAETKFFDEATADDFERREVPLTDLHPDFRRTGGGSCVVHVFRRRPESIERHRLEKQGERKEKRRREGGDDEEEENEEEAKSVERSQKKSSKKAKDVKSERKASKKS